MVRHPGVPGQTDYSPSTGFLNPGWPGVASYDPVALQNTMGAGPSPSSFVIAAPVGSRVNQGVRDSTKRPAPEEEDPLRPAKLSRIGNALYDHDQMQSQEGFGGTGVQNPTGGSNQPQNPVNSVQRKKSS